MTEQSLLIVGGIFVLTVVAFFVSRLLFERARATEPAEADGRPARDVDMDKAFEDLVQHSGTGWSVGQALILFVMTGLVVAAALFFWSQNEFTLPVGLALGAAGLLLALWMMRARRRRIFQSQLPDAFYFMARSLRAGLSLEQTINRAGDQLDEPLAGELRRCAHQINLGLHPHLALQNTARRIAVPDFDIFVATVGLYYHSGGNLALLLDRLAASTRDRINFLGYFRSATALGRIAGIFIASAVPILLIVYAFWQPDTTAQGFQYDPGHIIYQTAAGQQLLIIAVILEIIGIIWFLYLLRVDY